MIYRDAFGKALQDSMREEPKLMIIGQNLTGHALKALAETYGTERVRDCSISESAMVGMAVGAAMKGMKVVVMIAYADIASVCHMAIVQSAAKLHYLTNGRLSCPGHHSSCRSRAFAATGRKATKSAHRGFITCRI